MQADELALGACLRGAEGAEAGRPDVLPPRHRCADRSRDLGQRQRALLVRLTLLDASEFQQLFKLDDWNEVVIIAQGNHIQHYLNNRLILDFTDLDPQLALREGVLAFQLHAGKSMWAEFKNIRLKNLP